MAATDPITPKCFYHPDRDAVVRDNSESENSKVYLCNDCLVVRYAEIMEDA
jgi:hypothetical protein